MQYWHRMLQRSVTDSRRLRSGRANWSRIIGRSIVLRSEAQQGQPRARAREERPGRDLPVEPLAPAARNPGPAGRAAPIRADVVIANVVAMARDQRLAAARAARVLEVADLPRQVAR